MTCKVNKVFLVQDREVVGKSSGRRGTYNLDKVEWRSKCFYSEDDECVFFPIYQQEKLIVLDIVIGYGIASKHVVNDLIKCRPFVAPVRANKIMPEAHNGTPHVFFINDLGETCWLAQTIITDIDSRLKSKLNEHDILFINKQTFDLRMDNLCFVMDARNADGCLLRTTFPLRSYEMLMRTCRGEKSAFMKELKTNERGKVAMAVALRELDSEDGDETARLMEEFVLREHVKSKAIVQVKDEKKRRKRKRGNGIAEPEDSDVQGLSCGAGVRKVCRGVTKVPGIFYHPKNKFTAEISMNNNSKHIGVFDTLMEALKKKEEAELKYYGSITWITQCQLLDLEKILARVYNWDLNRDYFRCAKCKYSIQIHGVNELDKNSNGKPPTCFDEVKYREILAKRAENLQAVVRRDSDYVLCPCGWISSRISELFHFGIESAHIQNKLLPVAPPMQVSPMDAPIITTEMTADDQRARDSTPLVSSDELFGDDVASLNFTDSFELPPHLTETLPPASEPPLDVHVGDDSIDGIFSGDNGFVGMFLSSD